jgi:hypothetical protein
LLQSPTGATIEAMMKATGWQPHSVRGFLAGVVRKRLKLKLGSKKVDGNRVYQIAGGDGGKSVPLSLLKISTGLREAGDFREPAVPSRSWWRFSLPFYRSWFFVFAAAPRSNSRLSLFSIS